MFWPLKFPNYVTHEEVITMYGYITVRLTFFSNNLLRNIVEQRDIDKRLINPLFEGPALAHVNLNLLHNTFWRDIL